MGTSSCGVDFISQRYAIFVLPAMYMMQRRSNLGDSWVPVGKILLRSDLTFGMARMKRIIDRIDRLTAESPDPHNLQRNKTAVHNCFCEERWLQIFLVSPYPVSWPQHKSARQELVDFFFDLFFCVVSSICRHFSPMNLALRQGNTVLRWMSVASANCGPNIKTARRSPNFQAVRLTLLTWQVYPISWRVDQYSLRTRGRHDRSLDSSLSVSSHLQGIGKSSVFHGIGPCLICPSRFGYHQVPFL